MQKIIDFLKKVIGSVQKLFTFIKEYKTIFIVSTVFILIIIFYIIGRCGK